MGEPYSVAARAIELGRPGYHRSDWWTSGWLRLLPFEVTASLEVAITSATVYDGGATLNECLSRYDFRGDFPHGVATQIDWDWFGSGYDEESLELRRADQSAFRSSLDDLGFPHPQTVGELAHVLSRVGLYERIEEGFEVAVFKAPEVLLSPGEALPLPSAWLERDEEIRWRMVTSKAADSFRRRFLERGH